MARKRRYPSDTTDEQWNVIEPLFTRSEEDLKRGGSPAVYDRRETVDAILYLNDSGCKWRSLPSDFPPWKTVYRYFATWCDDGTLDQAHDALRKAVREHEGRNQEPTAAIIDAQSVKGADTVPK